MTGLHGLSSSSMPSSPSSPPSLPIDEADDVGIDEDIVSAEAEEEVRVDVRVEGMVSKLIWWNSSMNRTIYWLGVMG